MNWGAAVLVLAGGAILVVGVTGSQQSVCKAITGSDCSWLPSTPSNPNNLNNPISIQPNANETPGQVNIDQIIKNCSGSSQCSNYMTLATTDANNYGIDPNDFVRQIAAESSFNPNARSASGAEGIAQFMPATASQFNVNPFDPVAELNAAAQLMGTYEAYWRGQSNGNQQEVEALALSSYNYGFGGTNAAWNAYGVNWEAHVPAETQSYISNIQYPGTNVVCKPVNGKTVCSNA